MHLHSTIGKYGLLSDQQALRCLLLQGKLASRKQHVSPLTQPLNFPHPSPLPPSFQDIRAVQARGDELYLSVKGHPHGGPLQIKGCRMAGTSQPGSQSWCASTLHEHMLVNPQLTDPGSTVCATVKSTCTDQHMKW